MRILSRKKLEFRVGDGSTIVVEPLVFSTVPESIKEDPMFGWALSDGSIEVIETVEQQKKLENEPLVPTASEIVEEAVEGQEIPELPALGTAENPSTEPPIPATKKK